MTPTPIPLFPFPLTEMHRKAHMNVALLDEIFRRKFVTECDLHNGAPAPVTFLPVHATSPFLSIEMRGYTSSPFLCKTNV